MKSSPVSIGPLSPATSICKYSIVSEVNIYINIQLQLVLQIQTRLLESGCKTKHHRRDIAKKSEIKRTRCSRQSNPSKK